MRVYIFYASVFCFMIGLLTLITITFEQRLSSDATFAVAIAIMIISVAAASILSCFEPIQGFVNPETQTLMFHETA